MPPAVLFLLNGELSISYLNINAHLYWVIPLFGFLSAIAQIFYILASRLLSLSLFGLLSYVEPVLLAMVALIIGESITPEEYITYIGVVMAVLFLSVEGVQRLRGQKTAIG